MMATKYSIKRLEISIKNFIKVLSIALDRLQKHSVNIRRLKDIEDWSELHREQINATRTIQQIKANIREIEKVRNQVNDEDLDEFDLRVSEVKSKAVLALEDFLILMDRETASDLDLTNKSHGAECGTGDFPIRNGSLSESFPSPPSSSLQSSRNSRGYGMSQSMYQKKPQSTRYPNPYTDDVDNVSDNMSMSHDHMPLVTTSLHVAPQNSEASASWEQLRESIEDLNELVHVFAENVQAQQEPIDRIEDNIENAHMNVEQGTSHLAKIPWSNRCQSIRHRLHNFFTRASRYKAAMYPVVGAFIGGIIGGPIGLVAGMKLGGLAGIGGAAAGFAGGRLVKKRQEKIVEMEMTKMSYSMHIPDLSEDEDGVDSGSGGGHHGEGMNMTTIESTATVNDTMAAHQDSSSLVHDGSDNNTSGSRLTPGDAGSKGKSGAFGSSIKGWLGYGNKS